MKIVIFGLTVSSSWGNGHATLWRGLCRGLARLGHEVVFFERDAPYYRAHRDLTLGDGWALELYGSWDEAEKRARPLLSRADAAIVTSYCPDADPAADLLAGSRVPMRVFYDLDTPITLAHLEAGERVAYVPTGGLGSFDLTLSFTGGRALEALERRLGAKHVEPLYGSVDPEVHRPAPVDPRFAAELSYLGTYAEDRQPALAELLLSPARRLADKRFFVAGALYPQHFPWEPNVWYLPHLAPPEHPAFFCSARLSLNVTRQAMAAMGYCPSGRLFEAAACAAPLVSDRWEGLETFFDPGSEILIADGADDVLSALSMAPERLAKIGLSARKRALAEHTADHRAAELAALLAGASARTRPRPRPPGQATIQPGEA